jgi:polyisoprenoid-binding protein YceI
MTFFVKASVALEGTFEKWDATLTFPSTAVESGALDVKIQAASVNTGNGMKDDKLKSKDFFNVKDDPYITFRSTKTVQTGPTTFDIPGTFTIRGASKPETLNLTATGTRGSGERDHRDNGLRSQGLRNEQWHPLYQDCGPRRSDCQAKG